MTELKNLANHFLIAMPSMEDPFFSRSLTYICEHNEEGYGPGGESTYQYDP